MSNVSQGKFSNIDNGIRKALLKRLFFQNHKKVTYNLLKFPIPKFWKLRSLEVDIPLLSSNLSLREKWFLLLESKIVKKLI